MTAPHSCDKSPNKSVSSTVRILRITSASDALREHQDGTRIQLHSRSCALVLDLHDNGCTIFSQLISNYCCALREEKAPGLYFPAVLTGMAGDSARSWPRSRLPENNLLSSGLLPFAEDSTRSTASLIEPIPREAVREVVSSSRPRDQLREGLFKLSAVLEGVVFRRWGGM